ncbi:hypothetical protein IKF26_01850 [Candidatus Saccharibacteria bacterium]|nr:hypothetical protein [Candidatus Saccharibacteria bacterium]
MVNKFSLNFIKENKVLFLVFLFELVMIICLTIVLLVKCHSETSISSSNVTNTTTKHKPCTTEEYKAFDDRVFYHRDLKEINEDFLSMFSDGLTTEYPDSNIKVLIESMSEWPGGSALVMGHQIVNGVVLENTFFAIDAEESDNFTNLPLFINPDQIKLDGLMKENEAENIAYSAIEAVAKQNNKGVKGACSYTLFYTDRDNGVINKPASNFHYHYEFNFSNESNYPKGFVYVDGKTGEVLDSFIDTGIRN